MAYAGSRLTAACLRSIGLDARVAPDSDARTLDLGGLHTSGEECLPHKVTIGDFLKICQAPGFDPARTAFLMPTAHGPCRFGQYAPYLRQLLDRMGWHEAMVFSPTSANGYEDFGRSGRGLIRQMWMALVFGDLATRMLLRTRPYEREAGSADAAFEESVRDGCEVFARPGLTARQRLEAAVQAVRRMGRRFREVPAEYRRGRPLIGLVGEIFCRHNTFSNDDTARRIERLGGECWLSDIAEWVWYTNWYQRGLILQARGRFSLAMLKWWVKTRVQRTYEHVLAGPLAEELAGLEEPRHIEEVLALAEPYLPPRGAIGEMVLSAGRAVYLYRKGADGVLDISPFTCMNGIVCEAVYPAISRDHDDLPIRTLYFDGVNTSIDRDLEIFLDLARAYQRRKRHPRVYPACFGDSPAA